MRKVIVSLVLVSLLIGLCSLPVTAEPYNVVYFDDGSYIITEQYIVDTRAANQQIATSVKKFIDESGNLDWKITLTATFTYDGVTARCTATDLDVTIYDSSWYQISAYHNRSLAQGYADVQLGRRHLGVTVEQPTYHLTLTCTPDGNIC